MTSPLLVGKLPPELLEALLERAPTQDPQVLVGPGIGLDCAVLGTGGPNLLVLKSDPITFATEEIGWYAVQVNTNDIATTGATPRWLLSTLLLPEGRTDAGLVERISAGLYAACREAGITVIGGHTEITYGLERPILVGTLVGEVPRERLVTPRGARPGDRLLLTKGVPVEATAILANEFPDRLRQEGQLSQAELDRAQAFLHDPGIGVLTEARLATEVGEVHAMHDPTEGGLYAALWELAEACGHPLWVEPAAVPVPELSRRICQALGLDPLGAIASGALLLAVAPDDVEAIQEALSEAGIHCAEIGRVLEEPPAPSKTEIRGPGAWRPSPDGPTPLPRPARDEIVRLFEN